MSTSPGDGVQYPPGDANQDEQPRALAAVTIAYVFVLLAVPLRFYARKRAKVRYDWDDWLILAVLIPLSAYFALFILQIESGMGKHLSFRNHIVLYQAGYIGSIACYTFQTALSKASILCFYCRVFHTKRVVKLCWAIGVFVVACNLAMFIFDFVQCVPLDAIFIGNPDKCVNAILPLVIFGIINAAVNFLILGIPLYFISHLHMRLTQKIQLAGIFLLSGVVCIFGILRIIAHYQINQRDLLYSVTWASTWSFCEAAVAAVCACLPTLASLLTQSASLIELKAKLRAWIPFLKKLPLSNETMVDRTPTRHWSNIDDLDSFKTPRHSVRVWAGTDSETVGTRGADEPKKARSEKSQVRDGADAAGWSRHPRGILVQIEVEQRIEHTLPATEEEGV